MNKYFKWNWDKKTINSMNYQYPIGNSYIEIHIKTKRGRLNKPPLTI